jgi:hypothetical protein
MPQASLVARYDRVEQWRIKMRRIFFAVVVGLFVATIMGVPVTSQPQNSHQANPGSINYVEGQAYIGNETLSPNSVGSVTLNKGQTLTTQDGKVEILLTPGVFLRVDDSSAVKMVSPDLANTEVELEKGRAIVEVLNISVDNNIRVDEDDISTQLIKKGLYDFDAEQHQVRVFKGTAEVHAGIKPIRVTAEHEVTLNVTGKLKARGFDTRPDEDTFFRWCALRSGYLSEASVDEARAYIGTGPGWYAPGWYGTGWYWDPGFGLWTFIPAGGIFYSPFGWGFYSPIFVYHSPFFYGGFWPHESHRFGDFHAPYGHGFEPFGGFHGGGGFRGVGGFHIGGGFAGGGRPR